MNINISYWVKIIDEDLITTLQIQLNHHFNICLAPHMLVILVIYPYLYFLFKVILKRYVLSQVHQAIP